jgi:TolB-like protein
MNKVLIILFITLVFLLPESKNAIAYEKEIKAISSALAENIATSGKKSIAVVDFTDLQGNVTELGRFLSEEFSVALSESGKKFEVVDRSQLNSILKEQQFTLSGLVDPKTVQKIGAIAGVQCLVTGTLTPFGDSIRLSVKVLDTATARVIGGSRGDIAKTKAIEELLARGIGTGQADSSPTSVSNYVPSASSQKSKKIGDLVIAIKRLEVLKGSIKLTLDIFNQSDKDLGIAMGWNMSPTLTDEKGNVYISGRVGSTLISKSNNDCVLTFPYRDGIKNVGSNFSFNSNFIIGYGGNTYEVSFMDIKAQRPK